ncbi:hypothetical protein FHU38_004445 [Saccharomonospora amisosensis]|uniref:Uncharacterized protein n=1 Tax=Saccharomonospora amisosensis TaxID=1128677 RepID=A0A7X5UTT4_9PSEU|nr:hypothetical protein [Saccharomonospora amisosensis]NIJ14101.1 hypothetical protein [Saccharomonospora amisosensis]
MTNVFFGIPSTTFVLLVYCDRRCEQSRGKPGGGDRANWSNHPLAAML